MVGHVGCQFDATGNKTCKDHKRVIHVTLAKGVSMEDFPFGLLIQHGENLYALRFVSSFGKRYLRHVSAPFLGRTDIMPQKYCGKKLSVAYKASDTSLQIRWL
jgi:hypothetical protein